MSGTLTFVIIPAQVLYFFRNDGCHIVDNDYEHNSIESHAFESNSHEDSKKATFYQKCNFFISKTPNAPEQTSQPVVATSKNCHNQKRFINLNHSDQDLHYA